MVGTLGVRGTAGSQAPEFRIDVGERQDGTQQLPTVSGQLFAGLEDFLWVVGFPEASFQQELLDLVDSFMKTQQGIVEGFRCEFAKCTVGGDGRALEEIAGEQVAVADLEIVRIRNRKTPSLNAATRVCSEGKTRCSSSR